MDGCQLTPASALGNPLAVITLIGIIGKLLKQGAGKIMT